MASTDRHVNGPALIQVDTSGGTSFVDLGYSRDGVTITPEFMREDVHSDLYGPMIPHDVQDMGQVVRVNFDVITYDESVMLRVLGGVQGKTKGNISLDQIGALFVQNGMYHSLKIGSSTRYEASSTPTPHVFPIAILDGAVPVKVGTRVQSYQMTYRCLFHASKSNLYTG